MVKCLPINNNHEEQWTENKNEKQRTEEKKNREASRTSHHLYNFSDDLKIDVVWNITAMFAAGAVETDIIVLFNIPLLLH